MAVYVLAPGDPFPDPCEAEEDGLLALTPSLTPELVLEAYSAGVFPWSQQDGWYLWYSPDPRMVLRPEDIHVSRSLRKTLRRGVFEIRLDTAFEQVMRECAAVPRPDQDGTWISRPFVRAYAALHERGIAHSAEAWREGRLAGGLYGVALGAAFFGESMFSREADASKVAFVTLVGQLRVWGFRLVDCQVHTEHLESLGAREWPRESYLRALAEAVREPGRPGTWSLDGPAGLDCPVKP